MSELRVFLGNDGVLIELLAESAGGMAMLLQVNTGAAEKEAQRRMGSGWLRGSRHRRLPLLPLSSSRMTVTVRTGAERSVKAMCALRRPTPLRWPLFYAPAAWSVKRQDVGLAMHAGTPPDPKAVEALAAVMELAKALKLVVSMVGYQSQDQDQAAA